MSALDSFKAMKNSSFLQDIDIPDSDRYTLRNSAVGGEVKRAKPNIPRIPLSSIKTANMATTATKNLNSDLRGVSNSVQNGLNSGRESLMRESVLAKLQKDNSFLNHGYKTELDTGV